MSDIQSTRKQLSEKLREYEELTGDVEWTERIAGSANRIEDRTDITEETRDKFLWNLVSGIQSRIDRENKTGRYSDDAHYERSIAANWDGKNPYMGF